MKRKKTATEIDLKLGQSRLPRRCSLPASPTELTSLLPRRRTSPKGRMGPVTADGYTPPSDYQENTRDSLTDLKITDSTELWLMQFPTNLGIDFDKQEITLNLHNEGKLGSVEGSSGKEYDLVSFSSQKPDATVFASSSSESKIVGKISRLVSIVHYPEPNELMNNQKQKAMSLSTSSSAMKSARSLTTPSRSIQRGSRSISAATTHSSKQKSALSEELGDPLKTPKRQKNNKGGEGSNLDSGNFPSGLTSSASVGKSHHNKSKTKTKG